MWEQVTRIMSESTDRIVQGIAAFLPGLLALLLLVLAALVVGWVVRWAIRRTLQSMDFDRRAPRWGLGLLADWGPANSASLFVARVAQWAVLAMGLLTALTAMNAAMPSQFAMSVFGYVPHLFAAIIVLVVGAMLAQFISRAALIGAVNVQVRSARVIAATVRWLVLLVAVSMALEQLQIGRDVLLLAFGIVFGGVVLALSLAFGLGARDAVRRSLDRYLETAARREDHVDHV
ncbi:MAG TPA: hypothetical protein VLV15_07225 [Dongiaceae bacterium]|nr:hypothetical protein [Dongiaceae bacterium]